MNILSKNSIRFSVLAWNDGDLVELFKSLVKFLKTTKNFIVIKKQFS